MPFPFPLQYSTAPAYFILVLFYRYRVIHTYKTFARDAPTPVWHRKSTKGISVRSSDTDYNGRGSLRGSQIAPFVKIESCYVSSDSQSKSKALGGVAEKDC
ncbi:hypothetical protein Trydic_g8505 [Trypoxylus dichotomus]